MAGKKHPHKYKRFRYKTGTEIYFCTLPDCSHKVECAFTLGKESICNRCGEKFIMDEYSIRLAEPHCRACKTSKDDNPIEVKVAIDTSSLAEKLVANLKTNTNAKPKDEMEELFSQAVSEVEDFDL